MDNSSLIPKFIICKKGTNLDNLPVANYFRINEYDSLTNDANEILLKNELFITKTYLEKENVGDFNRFITHFLVWKYIYDNALEYAIVIEDNVRIFTSINKNINLILSNVNDQIDYVGMYLNERYLEQSNGEIEIATEAHQPHAYLITLNGARRLLKLTRLWKINRSLDKQIFYYIKQKFLRGYIIKNQFLYSNKIEYKPVLIKGIKEEFIKPDGLTMKEVQEIETELLKFKKIEVSDKLLEVEKKDEAIIQKMMAIESKEEDVIIEKISGRLNENEEDNKFIEKLSKKLYEILELEL
jgi:GR25 family glycosyltransferase involved in LPS biosynthesis